MIYDLLAPFYDKINADIDYAVWADFIEKIVEKHREISPDLWLDLGCGTGKMTIELTKRGRDMTGVDYSPEMLNIARDRADELDLRSILWLCQDIRDFELYGTVDVCISCLDTINHLINPSDLDSCFNLVHNYLAPNGLFIFDINGKYKFENIYADNSYVMEEDGAMCIWQNYYNSSTKKCDFYITLFEEDYDGKYERYDEHQVERMYTLRSIKKHLENNSLEFLGAYSDFNFSDATDSSERIYIVAKCKK